ncbi:YceI family protein [Aureibacter tunicatorum]|uniref:Polyisoprenoid-binding protein YceI n=1 Tax=Aureibacter tunicatorum TaxID=866807 RepID=A0AAE3XND5_9BACT|nr:YceI family protein [Aureibacter tunicatorum]MDR6239069.1 polyisoprenoid-binding protein YceI [Aureibacter tunicatorum]BDD05005.1 lipid-binding protein [Aureibacter tunicatorum]
MKKVLYIALALITFAFTNASAQTVDSKKSSIQWTGEKVTGKHWGHINIKSGDVETKNGKLVGGHFVINMNSITCDDIENKDYNQKLVGHLKNEDFFDVAKFPEAKFVITKAVEKKGKNGNNYEITGDLTIKGISHSITFPARVDIKGNSATANASVDIDRTKWNVKYGSGSFFDNLGDRTIYDEFNLKISLATKE